MIVVGGATFRLVKVGAQSYATSLSPTFFRRYLDVWDEVVVLDRLAHRDTPPERASLIDCRGVRVIGAPEFVGPFQYLKCRSKIIAAARRALAEADSVLFRGANPITMPAYYLLRGTGRPYGIEVIGDPHDSLGPGAIRHPLRPYFRWLFTREQRRACRDAFASTYVTARALQE